MILEVGLRLRKTSIPITGLGFVCLHGCECVCVCVPDLHVCFCENCVYSHRYASPLWETMIHASLPGFLFLIHFNPVFYPCSAGVCTCARDVHVCVLVRLGGLRGMDCIYIGSCSIILPLSSSILSHVPLFCPPCKSGLIKVFSVYLIYLRTYAAIQNAAGLHCFYFSNVLCHYPPVP